MCVMMAKERNRSRRKPFPLFCKCLTIIHRNSHRTKYNLFAFDNIVSFPIQYCNCNFKTVFIKTVLTKKMSEYSRAVVRVIALLMPNTVFMLG